MFFKFPLYRVRKLFNLQIVVVGLEESGEPLSLLFKESETALSGVTGIFLEGTERKNTRVNVIPIMQMNDKKMSSSDVNALSPTPGCRSAWNRDGIQFNDEEKKNGSMLYLTGCGQFLLSSIQ